ncbi:Exo-1,4-beta-D-glucosaminidase [Purpureocillium lavendulum]|uniref:Exo-1,4-beta-D-glucosaminidase n=1 Tax=Purpureocillium lavendulum TaxID=1247861 RepID=A0AB34FEQ1_9HYPO|nr:Exo-1,4-beta-D-glucosaminidase [Purpureocillium lavendulum]
MYALALLGIAALAAALPHEHLGRELGVTAPRLVREAKVPWHEPDEHCEGQDKYSDKCRGTLKMCDSLSEAQAAVCFARHLPNPSPKPWHCPETCEGQEGEACLGTRFICHYGHVAEGYNTRAACYADREKQRPDCVGSGTSRLQGRDVDRRVVSEKFKYRYPPKNFGHRLR